MRKFLREYPLLAGIVLAACILRCIAAYTQSFSNDELSAIYRLEFSNLRDLINWGIKVDGHPALAHLFLYMYVPLVPKTEWIIRLPFIVASTLSLIYFFRGFQEWTGKFTAYMVVIILAFSGFSIQLGYFARPYALGIFFISVAFYYWVKLFIQGTYSYKNLVVFTVASILACYSHYFALLQVAVFGLVAFVFSHVKGKKWIMISGVTILLAFLPHYFITQYQLSVGGIGQWLGAPKPYFAIDMVMEFFDRSALFIGLVLLLPMLLLLKNGSNPELKKILQLFLLAAIPFLILYSYSVNRNPLLQYSACFFLFPFLLGCFFSVLGAINALTRWMNIGLGSVAVLLVLHEVFVFRLFDKIHFAEFKAIGAYIEDHSTDDISTVVAVNNPFYIDYYLPTKRPGLYITDMGSNLHFFRTYVDTCKSDEFIYAFANQNSNPEVINIIRDKYPCRVYSAYYMNAEIYHFSRFQATNRVEDKSAPAYVFNSPSGTFEWQSIPVMDTNKTSFTMLPDREFSPALELNLDEMETGPNDQIIAQVGFNTYPQCDVELVISIESGSRVFWRSRKSSLQYSKYPHRTLTISESLNYVDVELENAILKVYLWNPNKCDIQANSFVVKIEKGNPFSAGYSQ